MVLKPPRLRSGDLIGLVSPASAPSSYEKIEKAVQYLEGRGYRVKVGTYVSSVHGYLAGADDQRAADFNEMIRDKAIKAVFAVRGGYGTPRILPLIDYQSLKRQPKIIVGYSDITALQLAIFRKTSLVTFSGPMAGVEMWNHIDPFTEEHFWKIVTSNSKVGELKNPPDEAIKVLKEGKGEGRLVGGNFATFASLLGTQFAPNLKDSILVLEDVDEAPHRIDRMLTQLLNARILRSLSGLIFGVFSGCVPSEPTNPYLTVEQILAEFTQRVECPVVANLQYGHIPRKLTVPIGLKGKIDTTKGKIEVLESGVI